MKIKVALLTLSCLGLNGCFGNLTSIYRPHDINKGIALFDAKQRALIINTRPGDERPIVCAEPSPDALSAYAAELAAEFSPSPTQKSALNGALQESSSNIGLRTQSIQLLRDVSFRICEGYQNGALSKTQYDILIRRHQRMMVSLMAIEQLTGVVKTPMVAITSQGSAYAMGSGKPASDESETDADATDGNDISHTEATKPKPGKAAGKLNGIHVSGAQNVVLIDGKQNDGTQKSITKRVANVVAEIVEDVVKDNEDGDICLVASINLPEWWDKIYPPIPPVKQANNAPVTFMIDAKIIDMMKGREAKIHQLCDGYFERMDIKFFIKARKDIDRNIEDLQAEINEIQEKSNGLSVKDRMRLSDLKTDRHNLVAQSNSMQSAVNELIKAFLARRKKAFE